MFKTTSLLHPIAFNLTNLECQVQEEAGLKHGKTTAHSITSPSPRYGRIWKILGDQCLYLKPPPKSCSIGTARKVQTRKLLTR